MAYMSRQYGKRLVSLDATSGPGVTATFEDGTTHTASLLIGAEGAHSNVRKYLLGEEKGQVKLSPIVLSCIISKLPVEIVKEFQQVHKRSCLLFHPNGTFFWLGGMSFPPPPFSTMTRSEPSMCHLQRAFYLTAQI